MTTNLTDLAHLVAPLVWVQSTMTSWNNDYHTLPTGYTVRCADENGWKWTTQGCFGYASNYKSAQAAAQADHAARVLAACPALVDLVRELEAALAGLMQAVCGDTGFANSVRTVSGFAYPWPALDNAEATARAALAKIGGEA